MALRIKVDASMKARAGTTVHCSASPRTAAYYAKARRDGLNARHIYTALLCSAVCFSTWALLSHQVSSSLPTHGPTSIWPSQPSGSSDSSARSRLRRGPSSLLFASVHKGSSSVPGGAAAVAAAAAVLGSKAATRRLTFQRTKTAMPFIMMTCRMCDDPMSQQVAAIKMYDPVTSTLVEHALSNTPDESRVFVEVGAGTGYFSMLAASWGTDVVAFEPNATSRQMLHYNAGLHKDGRVRIVPYALGARTTLATILSQQNSSDSSSRGNITSSSNSTSGPPPTFTPAANPTSSSTSSSSGNSSKGWPVDVLRLSDAIAGDAKMTVLLINVPSLDGVSVPGFVEAAEGAYDMLTRVQWVFLLGVPGYNTPRIHSVMSHMLARGNFSNLYSYGRPSEQQLAQGDDAQYEEGQQQQQQQQQRGNAADGSKAAAAASSYPADTHYVDITEAIRQPDAEFVLTHSDFLFTREPLSGTLHINMPKKLVWDWQVPPTAPPTPATAATGDNNSTAAAAAGGAVTTPVAAVPAAPMGPAPAGMQATRAADSPQTERLVTVYTPVSATQQLQQQQER